VLSDSKALQYISGVSYQWGGKIAIQRTFESWWPRIRLMQSENECGFGDNTWEYARYNWTMLKHYLANGAESYMYWNPILEPGGLNTWGDLQNAMITVDPETKTAVFNPDFYVMKHVSSPVSDGAVLLGTKGPWAGDTLAFRNPDGSLILNIFNPFKESREFNYVYEKESFSFQLEPQSINTIIFGA
jgi:glucosylceramidase